jgi:uncharacterized protein
MFKFEFEWDENKAKSNFIKHGLSFDDCKSAFKDVNAINFFDKDHTQTEYRNLLLGKNFQGITIIISYTIRNGKYRIISCRKANKKERKLYEEVCKNN